MTSAVELIVHFEDPGVDVDVGCNELGEVGHEVFLVVNIMSSNWNGNVGCLEYSFGSRLG